jgi:hypothetical protein
MKLNKIALVVVFLFALTASALAMRVTMQGKIMQVKDGDTVVVSPVGGEDYKRGQATLIKGSVGVKLVYCDFSCFDEKSSVLR